MSETAHEKGNALEEAVRAIEETILRSFPNFSESTFSIEGRRIVVVDGVRHEIDVYVKVLVGAGYDSIFIFECKNWKEKVGKNELIIFSEKVRAVGAMRGFFVARDYTGDAIAQAKLDSRIEVITARELGVTDIGAMEAFHGIHQDNANYSVSVELLSPVRSKKLAGLDIHASTIEVNGVRSPLLAYITQWGKELQTQRINKFPSTFLPEGVHKVTFAGERVLGSRASIDGVAIRKLILSGKVDVTLKRAQFVSAYEVGSRGRSIKMSLDVAGNKFEATFVQIDDTLKAAGDKVASDERHK